MKIRHKIEQSGRSMVEMLGVLAIIGVLSVGGIAGYSKAMGKFKLSKATDEISMLVANIHTLYSGQQNYSGLSTAGAISFGVVPTQMVQSNNSLTNAYSLPVTITSGTHNFVLSYGVPNREVCVAIATIDWHGGGNSDLNKIIINDSYEFASFPITLDSANTACSSISEGSQTAAVKMDFK